MRKFFVTCAAAGGLVIIATIAPPSAQAMTLAVPAGLNPAIHEANLTQDVAYVCRGWRRHRCWWTPGYASWGYGYHRPYTYYRPYTYSYSYYRPYRPWRWRYRRWWW